MQVKALEPLKTAEHWQINPESGSQRSAFVRFFHAHGHSLLTWTEWWIGNLFLNQDKWRFSLCLCLSGWGKHRDKKTWISCLFVCIICIMCLILAIACVCTRMHELHICPESAGFTDWFWARGLIALLQTQTGQKLHSQPLDTHKHRKTQSSREQCCLAFANVPPNAVDTHRVYAHMLHFSIGCLINFNRRWKTSRTFAQQCLYLINDSFGEKCDEGQARSVYFKRPLTHPGAELKTCSSLSSTVSVCCVICICRECGCATLYRYIYNIPSLVKFCHLHAVKLHYNSWGSETMAEAPWRRYQV